MSKELGFSVACYKGDVPLLRGCLASIKYFAPDAPICLVIDGDFDSRPFEKRYGLRCIRRRDVKNAELKKFSFGYGVTKMIALWEAPFERIIHVDADAVLWGDIRNNLPETDWDFVYNEPHEVITDFIQKTQYFDPESVFQHIEKFHWQGNPYFNSGVFASKVGVLDLNEYVKMLHIQNLTPGPFFLQDQSYLNIMIFRALHAGSLKVAEAHLQSAVPVLSKLDLENRFRVNGGAPIPWIQPTVVHWAGPKPYKVNPDVFSLPMDFFRELGMREFGLPKWFPTDLAMRLDECECRSIPKVVSGLKRVVKKAIGRPV